MSDLADRERTPISRSLAALERLYAVIMGLALTNGVRHVGDGLFGDQAHATSSVSMVAALACLVALVVTLFPFYNGVNRHLDLTYRFYPANRVPKATWLPMDLILLFGPSALFFAMSQTLFRPELFLTFTLALFVLDIVWAYLTKMLTRPSDAAVRQIHDWLMRNSVAAIVVGVIFLATVLFWHDPDMASILTAFFLTGRTVHDYSINAQHYFGFEVPTIAPEAALPDAPASSASVSEVATST